MMKKISFFVLLFVFLIVSTTVYAAWPRKLDTSDDFRGRASTQGSKQQLRTFPGSYGEQGVGNAYGSSRSAAQKEQAIQKITTNMLNAAEKKFSMYERFIEKLDSRYEKLVQLQADVEQVEEALDEAKLQYERTEIVYEDTVRELKQIDMNDYDEIQEVIVDVRAQLVVMQQSFKELHTAVQYVVSAMRAVS